MPTHTLEGEAGARHHAQQSRVLLGGGGEGHLFQWEKNSSGGRLVLPWNSFHPLLSVDLGWPSGWTSFSITSSLTTLDEDPAALMERGADFSSLWGPHVVLSRERSRPLQCRLMALLTVRPCSKRN